VILAFLQGQGTQIVTDAEREAEQVARVLPVLQALPAGDLLLGGLMLVIIVLIHGAGMRLITGHVLRRSKVIAQHPTEWRADLLLAGVIVLMLSVHLFETVVWTTLLVRTHLVSNRSEAGFFAANTYTTLGYGSVILPQHWKMLAPIMAISGMFTFGWTGSVLVDIVGRVNRLKDLSEDRVPPPAPASP
jgi:hypothetical protein